MAQTYNPFAPVERSRVQTPWGEFEIAPPNRGRLVQIEQLQREAEALSDDSPLEDSVRLAMRIAACGVTDGDKLEQHLDDAWMAGDITVLQVKALAEFVGAEISGEADTGND